MTNVTCVLFYYFFFYCFFFWFSRREEYTRLENKSYACVLCVCVKEKTGYLFLFFYRSSRLLSEIGYNNNKEEEKNDRFDDSGASF